MSSAFKGGDIATLKPRKAVMDTDENGMNVITERFLRDLCEENGQFATPHLNDTLYLHYKGFKKIEGLEKYYNLKSIWLECNGIQKIENLSHLTKLRMMYLHQNSIERIEGLDCLVNLVTLNLSYNRIKRIENLHMLPQLKNIDLSHNIIGANADPASPLECIAELQQCKQLTSVDLSHNIIDCEGGLVEFFEQCQNILCLYLKGNPCVRKTSMYRKRMTVALRNLQYLDDRPVFEIERLAANAWAEGGAEKEKQARQEYQDKKIAQMKSYTARGRELTEEARARRKEVMKKMLDELRKDKEELIRKRDELKAKYKVMADGDQQKQVVYMQIRKIEEDLKTEYYRIIEDKETDAPSVGKPKPPATKQPKLYQEEMDAAERERKRVQEEMRQESERLEREMQQEEAIRRQENEDYQRRESGDGRGKASGIIPVVNETSPSSRRKGIETASGAVISTDSSESERENMKRLPMQQFKWTPENEQLLEDILMKHFFDFHAAAKEFSRVVNDAYQIDAKSLQLRWTDIEIRKYRLNQPSSPSKSPQREADNEEVKQEPTQSTVVDADLEDDLPPLEEKPKTPQADAASSSDEEESSGKVAYYTNLEELD